MGIKFTRNRSRLTIMAPLANPNNTPPKLLIQLNSSNATILFNITSRALKRTITKRNIIIKLIIFDIASFHLNCFMIKALNSWYQNMETKIAEIRPSNVNNSAITPLLKPRNILNKIIIRITKSTQLIITIAPCNGVVIYPLYYCLKSAL